MKLVNCFGIWQLTDTKYRKLLTDLSQGKDVLIRQYGKYLGYPTDVTNITQEEACRLLEELVSTESP